MSETTHASVRRDAYCLYCGGRLNLGYHYVCHVCGDSYCYIHMSKHAKAHAGKTEAERVYAR